MEWIKGMSEEVHRLEVKVEKGEELTFSEMYFLQTVELFSNIFCQSK